MTKGIGSSVSYSRAIGHTTSIVTELLWGLRDGLILCSLLHLEAIEIELDAVAVVCLLNCNSESLGEFAYIVEDCRDFIRNLALLQRGVRLEQDFVTLRFSSLFALFGQT